MKSLAVECRGVAKGFSLGRGRRQLALAGVDLEVCPGEVFGLLGPNGAGKTTLLKILLGLLAADAGECRVFDQPAGDTGVRRRLGYVPDGPLFHPFASVRETLELHARLAGVASAQRPAAVGEAARQAGLAASLDRRLDSLSKGMLQRVGLAQALLGEPDLLIMDEPTAGLDPVAAEQLGRLVRAQAAAGRAVLLSTHQLSQAERICDRVAVLHRGRIVLTGKGAGEAGGEAIVRLRVADLPAEKRVGVETAVRAGGGRVEGWERASATLEERFHAALEEAERP